MNRALGKDPAGRIVAFFLGAIALLVLQWVAGPQTYEDCVLANAGAAHSDMAARAAAQACHAKFHPTAP